MTVLYFDCFSGASGDMILGALIDAGADAGAVRRAITALPIEDVGMETSEVVRRGLRANAVTIRIPDHAEHRGFLEIVSMLEGADLPPRVRARALRMFEILATAEARVHGTDVDSVHFHEVGALDAIADVVGAAVAIEHFDPATIACSPIPLGSGSVETDHGTLPVPAPAVTEILKGALIVGGGEREVTTPTGAAILMAITDRFGEPPPMTLHATGYGAGSADLSVPNVLRVLVGEEASAELAAHILVETNIDDMTPELIPHVIDQLLRAGAQDAWSTPILMKKGRPAFKISAIVDHASRERVVDLLYRETTTFGVRASKIEKDELFREWIEVDVEGHAVRVKVAHRGPEVVTTSPEYEDASRAAMATGMPLKDVYQRAEAAARRKLRV
ncbi:MAG: nickel pincer cofactor biosynthesis protein LarC [Actinobacteria bacterium]|nr:nickel pincer cofactor biosynthesis protein LarC [Actinomycetota bacterium]